MRARTHRHRFDRRAFLRGLGASAGLLPLLEADASDAACLERGVKRAVFFVWPNGSVPGNNRAQWPSGPSATEFSLGSVLAPFAPHKQDMIFLDRFSYQFLDDTDVSGGGSRNGHSCMQGLLTGAPYAKWAAFSDNDHQASGPSIDQHIGEGLRKAGYAGMSSLVLGVRKMGHVAVSWKAARDPAPADGDPWHAFDVLFGNANMAAAPDPALERQRQARKSVLDFLVRDVDRFSRTLGRADRERAEKHLETIRALETRLTAARAPATNCARPVLGPTFNLKSEANLPKVLALQTEVMHAALAADLTRVAVLHLSDAGGDENYQQSTPWLNIQRSWHAVSHNDFSGTGDKATIDIWLYSQFAAYISRCKAEREGDRSMFDNMVMSFMSNMSTGDHEFRKVPMFLAGSCGGYLRTGQSLKTNGGPHNPVLVTLTNAMDVRTTSFGHAPYNAGELSAMKA